MFLPGDNPEQPRFLYDEKPDRRIGGLIVAYSILFSATFILSWAVKCSNLGRPCPVPQAPAPPVVQTFTKADSFREANSGTCMVSWYGEPYHGRTMANGRRYDMNKLTVAHRTLPFGTLVKFTLGTRNYLGEVTDRGPYLMQIDTLENGRQDTTWLPHPERLYDVSFAGAETLKMTALGVAAVLAEVFFVPDQAPVK